MSVFAAIAIKRLPKKLEISKLEIITLGFDEEPDIEFGPLIETPLTKSDFQLELPTFEESLILETGGSGGLGSLF